MFLTRQQYDLLVRFSPDWMEEYWVTYLKRWSIDGVWVEGNLESLRYQLEH
jgi:hypothetical protein